MRTVKIAKFAIDNNIAYMIQQITSESTQEILAYFHGIGTYVGEDIAKNSKAQSWIEKNVILFYKDTSIPFRLRIQSGRLSDNMELSVTVSFPKKETFHDVSALMSKVVEVGLGLSDEEDMPKFDKPILKAPKCLKTVRIQQEEQRK